MTDYTVQANWGQKNTLAAGSTLKAISATELGTEFDTIATAILSKYDSTDRNVADGLCPLDSSVEVPLANLKSSTETAAGIIERATTSETVTGTATDLAVTPAGVEAVLAQNAAILQDISHLTDPGADRILFWDESDNACEFLTVGNGLDITTNTLSLPSSVAGNGLGYTTGVLSVNAGDGIEITGDAVTLEAAVAGVGLAYSSGVLSLDGSELTEFSGDQVDASQDHVLGLDNGSDVRIPIDALLAPQVTADTSGGRVLAAGDHTTVITVSDIGSQTITLPNSLQSGFWCTIIKTGASGTLTFSAAGTLNTANSLTKCNQQYGAVTCFHAGSNVWYAWGALDAA
jgi:hypothetical protein